MILILALRSLTVRPIRSAVLAAGFGLGVAVMAALLGVAAVILEQARTPELTGGGDVIIDGVSGRLANAKIALSMLVDEGPLAPRVAAATVIARDTLYLVDESGTIPIRARGGIPSLERSIGDSETAAIAAWSDAPGDAAWVRPDTGDVLREMDRFHAIPHVEKRRDSWAEWLYFNGRTNDAAFYLTFLAGPRLPSGQRHVGVRLQLDEGGQMTSYSDSAVIDEQVLLTSAPNLTVGRNSVRLTGHAYQIQLDLPAEAGGARAQGGLVLHAEPSRSLPPLTLRGAGGWVSGYVVPAMSGLWQGRLLVRGQPIEFDGGAGYHDHNWGFWEGVTWQWGQVQGGGLSFVYGRVRPPSDVADPDRVPAFMMALGPDGPLGYSTDVTITETNRLNEGAPQTIVVRGRHDAFAVTIEMASITSAVRSRFDRSSGVNLVQMHADAHVSGHVRGESFNFIAPASAETFRGDAPEADR